MQMSHQSHQRSSAINSKQRVLGSAENALMKISLQHQGYMKVGAVLHLQGPYVSLERLTSAVSCLQRRHPFLRSRLENSPAKPDSYVMEDDNTLQLTILEMSRKHEDHLTFWRQQWQEREKVTAGVGQGLAQFWLLQDPDDRENDNAPREIVLICEHSICDGLSLSTIAHELLMALDDADLIMFDTSLHWPMTMEAAIQQSLSMWGRLVTFGRLILLALYWYATSRRPIARIPLTKVEFPLVEMAQKCHTGIAHGMLSKEETRKLLEQCRREGVTVTSAVSAAILRSTSALVSVDNNRATQLILAIPSDTRRRCTPPVPNHDLSYQVSGTMGFTMLTTDAPWTSEGMWQLAKAFGHHVKKSIDAGQTLALGMMMGQFYEKSIQSVDMAKLPTCGISNWGVLPFHEQYGPWQLAAMTPFGNMIRAAMPFVLVATVNGVLTMACLRAVPVVPSTALETLLCATMDHLRQMIEQ